MRSRRDSLWPCDVLVSSESIPAGAGAGVASVVSSAAVSAVSEVMKGGPSGAVVAEVSSLLFWGTDEAGLGCCARFEDEMMGTHSRERISFS